MLLRLVSTFGLVTGLLLPAFVGAHATTLPDTGSEGVLLRSVPISAAGGRWTWENPRPQGNTLRAITCPTSRVCYGVGEGGGEDGMIVSTVDGGKSWRSAQGGGISAISCPTSSTCYTVETAIYRLTTADLGLSWRRVEQPLPAPTAVRALACPGSAICYALAGEFIYRTRDAGRTWAITAVRYAHGKKTTTLDALSCVSATRCVAVGSYDVPTPPEPVGGDLPPCAMGCFQPYVRAVFTTDGWKTWREALVPKQQGGLASIACPTRSLCYAGAGRALVSTDGGHRWTALPEAAGGQIACPSAHLCFAASFSALRVTRDGGHTWATEVGAPHADWNDISCPTTSRCVAVGWFGAIAWTMDGGRHWSGYDVPDPPRSSVLYTVACPSARVCYAGGSSNLILGTKGGGASWTAQLWSPNDEGMWGLPYAYGVISISCPSDDKCYAILGQLQRPFVIETADGGKTWNGYALPSIPGNPSWWQATSISCPAETVCTIVSEGGWVLRTENGTTWTVHSPPVDQSLTRVTCTDRSSCIAMSRGGVPVVTRDGGSTWVAGTSGIVDPNGYALASSCPMVDTCYLITVRPAYAGSPDRWDLRRTTDGGRTWADVYEARGDQRQAFTAIDCVGESVCVLLGSLSRTSARQKALVTTDGGRSFTQEALSVAEHLSSIACAPVSTAASLRCVIVGDYGMIIGMRG